MPTILISVKPEKTINDETYHYQIEKNDLIYMVVDNNDFNEVVKEFGHDEVQAQKIVIIGGGNIGRNTTILRSNYLHDANNLFYDHGMQMWKDFLQCVLQNYNDEYQVYGTQFL